MNIMCTSLIQNFWEVEASSLSRTGTPLFDYSLRQLLCFYYGFLYENRNEKQRKELDAVLDGPKATVDMFDAFDEEIRRDFGG